jgi:molecular chaperone GrpE
VHHQAMFEIEDPERPAGSVAQVVQAGYRIGERVLRPAMVGVAKGGPKQKPQAADETAEGDGDSGTESTAQPVDSSSS